MKLKYIIPALGIILFSNTAKAELCREYTKTINVGGRTQQGYGTACLQPDGSWEVVSEDANIASYNQSYGQVFPEQNVQYIVKREYVNTSPFNLSFAFGNLWDRHHNHGFHNHHRHHKFCGHRNGNRINISYNDDRGWKHKGNKWRRGRNHH